MNDNIELVDLVDFRYLNSTQLSDDRLDRLSRSISGSSRVCCEAVRSAILATAWPNILDSIFGLASCFTFIRHTFLVVSVKKSLKSVYVIYGCYREIKPGYHFWTTL